MAVRRNAPRRKVSGSSEEDKRVTWTRTWLDEAAAVFCLAVSVFLLIILISLAVQNHSNEVVSYSGGNWMGPVGHFSATLLTGFMGWCALVPVICLLWLAVFLWRFDKKKTLQGWD